MNVSVSPVRGEIMSIYLFPNCFLLQPISCSHPFLHSSFVLSACSSLVVVEAIIPDSNSSFNSLDNIFLLSAQLVASMFNLIAGNFQHVQLATALVQLRTGARMSWNQSAAAQHSTALDAQPLSAQLLLLDLDRESRLDLESLLLESRFLLLLLDSLPPRLLLLDLRPLDLDLDVDLLLLRLLDLDLLLLLLLLDLFLLGSYSSTF